MIKSILLVGVGGQGTILAGKILTTALLQAGYDVKMSEIHGMSQRGGSVSTHVRYGCRVESPVIELGGADILVGFELMEAVRWLEYQKPGGIVIVNDYKINPMPVLSGQFSYPDNLLEVLQGHTKTVTVKAFDEAVALGDARAMNTLLLGAAVERIGLSDIDWDDVIGECVKPAFVDLNRRALAKGRELAKEI
ncbi:MAG: indolepyruvate oxidoreductase subunit beta [Defluviitaleaceae bacterium]|nr:indolepyruvate oxidoreductase subunit beta [Defluviitaleaceae bacterium]MCL2837008.1 indolepyruvate oxidoreductase subunit beta [Defluviitaleaceae bacterium]